MQEHPKCFFNGSPVHLVKNPPKVLIFDIESSYSKAYTFDVWNANIGYDNILEEWFLLSFSAKWLFDDKAEVFVLSPSEVKRRDDTRIVKRLWEFLDKADIVIAHNAKKFDIPKSNSRFIQLGLTPPSTYQVIDTLQEARRVFGFSHNSLNALAGYFGLDPKLETSKGLWKQCMAGDKAALEELAKYNKQDVLTLEDVYMRMRSWIRHPNMALFMEADTTVCPVCAVKEITFVGKPYRTQVGIYTQFRCKNCGAIGRMRKTTLDKQYGKVLGVKTGF
jgi:hypothetical protein